MRSDVQQRFSLWMATNGFPKVARMETDVVADVCIVGAGIAGLSTAYLLVEAGLKVVVLDRGEPGSGQTGRTTAHLSYVLDDSLHEIERLHGLEGLRLAIDSHKKAISMIEDIAKREGIACDFERLDGYLFVPPGESLETLEREFAAAQRAGLVDVSYVTRAPLENFDTGQALRFRQVAQFDPMRYLNGLAQAVLRKGGLIFGDAHVTHVTGGDSASVLTRSGTAAHVQAIVVATNSPINNRLAIHSKQAPYLTYAIAARIPQGSVARALYWDTYEPYHYVRVQQGRAQVPQPPGSQAGAGSYDTHDYLIVGGEDHRTGQENDAEVRFALLESWARGRFPVMEEIEFKWSGQVMETIDGLAFIGHNPGDPHNVYVATGDSGMGMTHGTIAGILLRDLILGKAHEWQALYNPGRKTLGALGAFLRENLSSASQYADYLRASAVQHTSDILPGEGAVIKKALAPVAAFRDLQGNLHERSAVCPHLGCIVHWNTSEKTWDCPCHGSRFDALGQVFNGPAAQDLKNLSDEVGKSGSPSPGAKENAPGDDFAEVS